MQRVEALEQITAGVAHDFNNLLTVVLGNLDYVARRVDPWARQAVHFARRLSYARTAAEHCSKLIAPLLAFSHQQPLEPQVIDVNVAIADMRYLLQSTLRHAVRPDLAVGDRVWPVAVDAPQLELVIFTLTITARDAMPDGGRLRLATTNATLRQPHPMGLAAGDYVVLSVCDSGVGMTDEVPPTPSNLLHDEGDRQGNRPGAHASLWLRQAVRGRRRHGVDGHLT
jgi:signal transduction histidine kinase